jgi:hypothetical protein
MSCSTEADPALGSAYGGYSWRKEPFIFVINYPQGAACAGWVFQLLQIFGHALVRIGGVQKEDTSRDLFLVYGGKKMWRLHVLIPGRIVILSFQG